MNKNYLISAAIGSLMIGFGISQLRKPSRWTQYIPDSLEKLSPVSKERMIQVHSLGNLSLGLALLSGIRPKIVSTAAGSWWAWVAPFCGREDWRTSARDATIAIILLIQAAKATK